MLCFGVSQNYSQGVSQVVPHLRLDWGGISFLTHSVVGRIQALSVCQVESLSFLVTLSQRPPSAPGHMSLSTWQLTNGNLLLQIQQKRESLLARWVTIFCNTHTENLVHHGTFAIFCWLQTIHKSHPGSRGECHKKT